jgi:hypothetical protein
MCNIPRSYSPQELVDFEQSLKVHDTVLAYWSCGATNLQSLAILCEIHPSHYVVATLQYQPLHPVCSRILIPTITNYFHHNEYNQLTPAP